MFNIFSLKHQVARLMAPEGDGGTGGAAVDRGDTLSAGAPVVDDQAARDAAAEAERIRADEAAKAGSNEGKEGDEPKEGETAEEAAERKAAKGKMIPVERHSAILAKAREERDALAAQLAQQAKGREVAAVNADITKIEADITTKEAEYNKALIDGEVDKATKLMRDIRALERNMGDMKANMLAQVAESNAIERVRYDTVVERLEEAYPALNPDHESFDKAQVAEVMDLQSAYVLKGLAASAALQKAVKLIMGADTAKQRTAATTTPRVDADAVAEAKRIEEATKKAIDTAKRTPPSPAKVGIDSDKLGGVLTAEKVMNMSQGQFAKLDEATLAKLRGDDI